MASEKGQPARPATASAFRQPAQPMQPLQPFTTQGPNGQQMQFMPFPPGGGYPPASAPPSLMYASGQRGQHGTPSPAYPQAGQYPHGMAPIPQGLPVPYHPSPDPSVHAQQAYGAPAQLAAAHGPASLPSEPMPVPGRPGLYFLPHQYGPQGAYPPPHSVHSQREMLQPVPSRLHPDQTSQASKHHAPSFRHPPHGIPDSQWPIWCFQCQQWHSTPQAMQEAHGNPPAQEPLETPRAAPQATAEIGLSDRMAKAIEDAVSARLASMGLENNQYGSRNTRQASGNYDARRPGNEISHDHYGHHPQEHLARANSWRSPHDPNNRHAMSDAGYSGNTVRTYEVERRRGTSDSVDSENGDGTGLPLHYLPSVPKYDKDYYSYQDPPRYRDEPRRKESFQVHRERESDDYPQREPLRERAHHPHHHSERQEHRHRDPEQTPTQQRVSRPKQVEESPYTPTPKPAKITPRRGQENYPPKNKLDVHDRDAASLGSSQRREPAQATSPPPSTRRKLSSCPPTAAEAMAAVLAYAKWFAETYNVDPSFIEGLKMLQPQKRPQIVARSPSPDTTPSRPRRIQGPRPDTKSPPVSPSDSYASAPTGLSLIDGGDNVSSVDDNSTTAYEDYKYEDLMASENDYATENEVDDKELIRQEWKRRLGKTKDKKSMEIRGGTNGSTATVTLTSENTPIPDSKNAGSNSRVGIGSLRGLASVLDRKNRQISGSGLSVQSYTTALVGESERDDEPNEQNMNLDRMPGSYSMTFDSATKNRNAVSQESHPSQGTPKTPARKSRDRPSGSTHGSRDQYVGGLFERSPRQYTSKKPALGRMSLSPQEERHCYPPVVDGFEDSEQTPRAIPDRTSRTYSMKFESPKNTDKKASTKAPESRNADKKPATKTPEVKRSARKVTNPTVKTIPDDLSDGHGWRWNPEVGGYVDDEGVSVPPMDNDMPSEYEGDAEEIQPRRVRQGGRQSEQRESTRSNSRVYEMHRGRDGGVTGRTDYHGSHVFVERRRRKKRE